MTKLLQAIFFDLDGTLLHTAPDLIYALNQVLHQHQRDMIPFQKSDELDYTGSDSILSTGFGIDIHHPDFPVIKEKFIRIYQQHSTERTHFFPGMSTLLDHLDQQAIPWGVITNKPEFLTIPLMHHFKLHDRSRCIIAGDTLTHHKPHPEPLLHACKMTQTLPEHAWYVGDAYTDIVAAKAAGLNSIAVTYGYHDKNNPPKNWQADYVFHHAMEILLLVKRFSK